MPCAKTPLGEEILSILAKSPPLSSSQLCKMLKEPHSFGTVSGYLSRLKAAGAVQHDLATAMWSLPTKAKPDHPAHDIWHGFAPQQPSQQPSLFHLDDNIPIPPHKNNKGQSIYPFATMKLNQSFFLPNNPKFKRAALPTVSSAVNHFCKTHPSHQFTCRTVTENGVKGARCWRIK